MSTSMFIDKHKPGPGKKNLWTLWKSVAKGSKSDKPEYRKPNILKSKRKTK